MGACHHTAGARMNHPSEGAWALDGGHHGGIEDQIARGLDLGTGPGDNHDLHAAEAILGCVPTKLCLLPLICYESCCATEKQPSSVPGRPKQCLNLLYESYCETEKQSSSVPRLP